VIAIVLAVFLAGLLVRQWCERSEARHLHLSVDILYPGENEESEVDPNLTSTVLRRTRMALSAAKLMRLVSLFLLIPTSTLLVAELLSGTGSQWDFAVLRVVASTLFLFLIIFLLHAVAAFHIPSESSKPRTSAPEWILREDVMPPISITAAWYAWETLVMGIDRLLMLLGLGRPSAQLIEQDQEVRLSVDSVRTMRADKAAHGRTSYQHNENDDRTARQMVRSIEDLDKTLVREVMRPINKVTAVRLPAYNSKRLLSLCRRTGYTRIPVYEDTITNLVGYINVYDLLEKDKLPENLRPLVIRPLFVPEVARVNTTLQEMIRRKQQVAIVFDEYGGTSGWLSREDILEEIVGEVGDEYEHPQSLVERVGNGYLVDASMNLDDVREEMGLDLFRRNYDTIAGWIYHRLGRAPRRGEIIEEAGWKIIVSNTAGHRVSKVRLIPPPTENGRGENGDVTAIPDP
jgi:Mg2+/Co2+ transporter CorC